MIRTKSKPQPSQPPSQSLRRNVTDTLQVAISGAITVLTKALDGSVALEDIEKAVFDLMEQHPPTLLFSEVEVRFNNEEH